MREGGLLLAEGFERGAGLRESSLILRYFIQCGGLFGSELFEGFLGLFEVGDVGLRFREIAIDLGEFVGRTAGASVSQIRLRCEQIRAGLRELRANVGRVEGENQLPL